MIKENCNLCNKVEAGKHVNHNTVRFSLSKSGNKGTKGNNKQKTMNDEK